MRGGSDQDAKHPVVSKSSPPIPPPKNHQHPASLEERPCSRAPVERVSPDISEISLAEKPGQLSTPTRSVIGYLWLHLLMQYSTLNCLKFEELGPCPERIFFPTKSEPGQQRRTLTWIDHQ